MGLAGEGRAKIGAIRARRKILRRLCTKIDIVQRKKRYTSSLRGANGYLLQNYTRGLSSFSKDELRLQRDEVPPMISKLDVKLSDREQVIILATIPLEVEMATDDLDTMSTKELAIELGFPEGSARYQKAKAELNYRQLKGLEQQQIAMLVQMRAIEVQRVAATAEAKAAEASTISAKAAGEGSTGSGAKL